MDPWDSPGKNTGMGYHFLLQGIFLTEELNPCILHWPVDSLPLSPQGSPTEVLPSPRNRVLAGRLGIFWSYLSSSEVISHVGPFQPPEEGEVTHLIRPFCPQREMT